MAKDLSRQISEVRFRVGPAESGQRLDHFIGDRVFWRSRTDLQKRVRAGTVLINGSPRKASAAVREGDEVTVLVNPEDLPDQDPASIELSIIEEDEHMVVLDKQPGLVVHPTGRHVYDTMMNALALRYRLNGEAEAGVEPHVVHRLDRNTSGVMVVAKNFESKQFLQDEFQSRRPQKAYLALCEGLVEQDEGAIDFPLDRDPNAEIRLKMGVIEGGLASLTNFEVVERFEEHSLVRALPRTGRQHQIRVHLAAVGHPIVADPLYGDPRSVGVEGGAGPLLERQALHAEQLHIKHPTRKVERHYEASCAPDMQALIDALRDGRRSRHLQDDQSARWA